MRTRISSRIITCEHVIKSHHMDDISVSRNNTRACWTQMSLVPLFIHLIIRLSCSLSYHVIFQILTRLFLKIGIKTNNKIKKDKPKVLYAFGTETDNLEHFKLLFKSAIVFH